MPFNRDAAEYMRAKVEQWMKEVGANPNSPNDMMAVAFAAAYEDWQARNQGRDIEPRDART